MGQMNQILILRYLSVSSCSPQMVLEERTVELPKRSNAVDRRTPSLWPVLLHYKHCSFAVDMRYSLSLGRFLILRRKYGLAVSLLDGYHYNVSEPCFRSETNSSDGPVTSCYRVRDGPLVMTSGIARTSVRLCTPFWVSRMKMSNRSQSNVVLDSYGRLRPT